ncbi:MAG: hypothetical protein AAF985_16460 [Bacteroidota bacterium]
MEQNNFKKLEEEDQETEFPMDEMQLNIANNIHSFRQVGELFGNFFSHISHLLVVFFGGKSR